MSFSYDNSLPANLDWVRRLINDVNSSSYFFEDEELLAYIAEANKYLAAAAALDTMHQAWISKGKGVASKKVDDLAITFGTGVGINVDLAMEQKITHLKKKAASLLSVSPHSFRML
jgi:hypothetical protein